MRAPGARQWDLILTLIAQTTHLPRPWTFGTPTSQLWCTRCIGVRAAQLGDIYTLLELHYVKNGGTDAFMSLFQCSEPR